MPGVVAFYSASDIPGSNVSGEVFHDEEVLATSEVKYVGQPIGIIVAKTHLQVPSSFISVALAATFSPNLLLYLGAVGSAKSGC